MLKDRVFFCLLLILVFVLLNCCGRELHASIAEESAREIGEAYQMADVEQVVSGMVNLEIRRELKTRLKEWTIDAFEDGGEKAEIKKRLKEKIREQLPQIAKKVLENELFRKRLGNGVGEVAEIVDRIISELKPALNERLDQLVGQWYDRAISEIDEYLKYEAGPMNIDLTNVRGTLENALRLETVERLISGELSKVIGESTVQGIRERIKDVLAGELPPEVLDYLDYGPEKFSEFASRIRENLPGEHLDRLKDELLHTPLFVLPNSIYTAILATSAATHYAKAFKGVHVDPYELKRGGEVTRVLVWQASNKEGLSVDLASFVDAAKFLSERFGLSLDKLGQLGRSIKDVKNELDRLEKLVNKIDKLIVEGVDQAEAAIKEAVGEIQSMLEQFQNKIFEPVIDAYETMDRRVDEFREGVLDSIPEDFSGIPPDWEKFKDQFDIEGGLVGKFGDISPWEVISKYLNDRVSGALAAAATEIVDAFGFTDRLARALGIENVPKENASLENPLDPVFLHNGEFYSVSQDLFVPVRSLHYSFVRSYRSRAGFFGVLGHNWFHNFEESLVEDKGDQIHIDGFGRKFVYKKSDGSNYQSPRGIFSVLQKNVSEFVLRDPNGLETHFDLAGRMIKKADRHGNSLNFEYDKFGRVAVVVDALGREYRYRYNKRGFLETVTDFSGREIRFVYDQAGDLIAVTGPKTFDYPKGKTKRYAYSFGYKEEDLNHNLVRIMDPAGNIYLKIRYGTEGESFDRVIAQQYGAFGEKMTVSYDVSSREVMVTDRRGVLHKYIHNEYGNLLREIVFGGDGKEVVVGENSFDQEGLLASTKRRNGITYQYRYDNSNSSRLSQGNLISEEKVSRGGDKKIETVRRYEPKFNQLSLVRYPNGLALSIDNDDRGNPVRVVAAHDESKDNLIYRFEYNEYGEMVDYIDPEGGEFLYRYKDGNLVEDPIGHKYNYDSVGNVSSVADPLGNVTHYSVNALNQPVVETLPLPFSYRRKFIFDANDNLSKMVFENPNGKDFVVEYEYDDLDRVVSMSRRIVKKVIPAKLVPDTDRGAGIQLMSTRWKYDGEGNVVGVVYPEGNKVEFGYDNLGDLVKIVRSPGSLDEQVIKVDCNGFGDLVGFENGAGQITSIEYDDWGRQRRVVNPVGASEVYSYDDFERLVGVEWLDRTGRIMAKTRYEYDLFGRLISTGRFLDDGKEGSWVGEKYFHNRRGDVVKIVDRMGHSWSYRFDKFGNQVEKKGPLGNSISYEYDDGMRLKKSVLKENNGDEVVTDFGSDQLGRLTLIVDTYGGERRFKYDFLGNVVEKIGSSGFFDRYFYDGLGRIAKISSEIDRGVSLDVRFTWDRNSRLTRLVDDNGNTTEYRYDDLDRLVASRYADETEEKFDYDQADNLTLIKKRSRTKIYNLYDSVGNIVGKRIDGNRIGSSWQWFAYDDLGRMIASLDNNDPADDSDDLLEHYRYDSLSRRVGEKGEGGWLLTNYDQGANSKVVSYPSGRSLYKVFDDLSRLKMLVSDKTMLMSRHYNGVGDLANVVYGNGINEVVEADLLGNILQQSWMKDGFQLDGFEYSYAPGGFVKAKRRRNGPDWKYSYDGMGRLVSAEGDRSYKWKLDGVGNWLEKTVGEDVVEIDNNGMNQIVDFGGKPVEYDADGNLIKDNRYRYRCDGLGRLVGLTGLDGDDAVRYRYDALNRMVKRDDLTKGSSIKYLYDAWDVVEVYTNDTLSKSYLSGKSLNYPVASMVDGKISYYHTDYLGSVVAVSDFQGGLVEKYDYQPYDIGGLSVIDDNDLVYLRNRFYNMRLGRFATEDPLGFKNSFYSGSRYLSSGLVSADIQRRFLPQPFLGRGMAKMTRPEMNRYLYAKGNPVNYTDPLGLRVFLEREGNNIDILLTVETYGPHANSQMNDMIKSSVESYWSGSFGRYNVTATADVALRSGGADYDRHRIDVNSTGRSYVDCVGCSTSHIYLNETIGNMMMPDLDIERTIAHEVGHFFGIDDMYDKDTSLPKPGWDGNLMACVDERCSVDEKQIEKMLEAYNSGEMNIGLHRYKPSRYSNRLRRENSRSDVPLDIDYK